ncbi:MAG: hypothetical protein WBW62_10840 [Solirubrobacterales bacterium]
MSDFQLDEQQLLDINTYLKRTDDVLIHNCLTRTAQESKLFPIMPYLQMCFYDSYYRMPDQIRKASEKVSPEEMGHRARGATTNMSKLTSWGTLNFYLNGRTNLIKAGLLRAEDNLEDLWTMVDWHKRFSASYHRNSAHHYTLDSWDIAQEHDERVLQVFEADAFEANTELKDAASKFIAIGTQYSFLVNCESRCSLQSSGPYAMGDRRLMHTRDFTNLAECDFSWLDGVADGVTHNNLTMSVITDDVSIEISDWGTPYSTPDNYQDHILGVGLYTSDFLTDRYIPVGMDSRDDLINTLNEMTEQMKEATKKLYRRFSEMSMDQMIEAGIYVYFQCSADIAHMAGTYEQSEWEYIDDRTVRFWGIHNEEFSLDEYVSHFAAMDGKLAAQNDYYLHPVSYKVWKNTGGEGALPAPGRNANLIPAHVLNDHDYPLRVNPNGLSDSTGTSRLPAKSTKYTFACGKLTEDEMNKASQEFNSPLLEAPWRYIDEQTVKWHSDDPDVQALYRYTQEGSRLIEGQGSGLVRADIEKIRRDAGEKPWSELGLGAENKKTVEA